MKLIDAINNVIIPPDAYDNVWSYHVPDEEINEDLSIKGHYGYPDAVRRVFKSFPIYNWCCTDTHVGLNALVLNGEPVGCTYQSGRKMNMEVEWISTIHAQRVRTFILEHLGEERCGPTLMDPNQEIGDDFAPHYVGQHLTHHGFYDGKPVTAKIWYDGLMGQSTAEEYRREGHPYTIAVPYEDERSNCAAVVDEDGNETIIPVNEFRLKFNVDYDAIRK